MILKYAEALGLSFKNIRELNCLIDQKLPGHPHFHCQQIQIGDETVELHSRDVLQCIEYIYSKPEFAGHLIHKPERHYAQIGGRRVQVFHDMHTGQWWWSIQVCACVLPHIFFLQTLCTSRHCSKHGNQAHQLYRSSSHRTAHKSPYLAQRLPIQST